MLRKSSYRADYRPGEPFLTAEEAWMWCCWCEMHKYEGNHASHSSNKGRPCESSDILIVLKRLVSVGKLKQYHVKVLSKYGLEQAPPHISFGATFDECRLWREALSVMEEVLIKKRIVVDEAEDVPYFMYLQSNYKMGCS